MKKIIIYLIITLISIACSNHQKDIAIIESNFTPANDTVLVVTPGNYRTDNNYPLVILLHGWSGNYNQWNSIVNLQDYANAYNFIIACPDGFYDSWYLNNPLKPTIQFEDFFWKDFIPYLTKTYSIDKNNIFISGLSMGGHGAITLFLKEPDFFKSAGSTSGILDLTFFPDRWSIKDGIGSIKDFPNTWEDNSAFYLLDSLTNFNKKMIIDCGSEDFAYQANLNFVKKSYDLNLDVQFISIPGDHSRTHWKKMIGKHFEFFYQQL
jgi:S-formylglutathione hydrolase FrmB